MRWASGFYSSAAVLIACLVAACDGPAHPPTSPATAPPSEARSTAPDADGVAIDGQLEPVARDLALALQQQPAANALRDALRTSPLVGHAIVLQDWITTGQGAVVANAAAVVRGISPSAWVAEVRLLPRLDAWLPIRAHRVHWQATPGLIVGVTRASDPHAIAAYGGDGRRIRLTPPLTVRALLLLQPSERRFRRIDVQRDSVGLAVQDSTEADLGGGYAWRMPKGDTVRVELADLVTIRRTAGAHGAELVRQHTATVKAAAVAPADTTLLTSFDWFYDIPNRILESIHVEFAATYSPTPTSPTTIGTLTFQGVTLDSVYHPNVPLVFARVRDHTLDALDVEACSDEILDAQGHAGACDTPDVINWADTNQTWTLYGFDQPHQDGNFTVKWTHKPVQFGQVTISLAKQVVNPDPGGFYPGLYFTATTPAYQGLGFTTFTITADSNTRLDNTAATLGTSDPNTITWDICASATSEVQCSLTGHKAGTATISVSVGSVTASQPYTVAPSPVAGFSFSITNPVTHVGLFVGESPHVIVFPLDKNGNQITFFEGTLPYFIYASQNPSIATFTEYDGTGIPPFWNHAAITGLAPGKTTVSATITQVSGYLSITVGQNASYVTDVTLTPNPATITYGTPLQLTATALNAKGAAVTPQTFTWTSSNTSVASVSSTGLVTGNLAGQAVISAKSSSQGVIASVTVSVLPTGSISGPATLTTAGNYTWTATGHGCNTTCTFQWREEQLNMTGGFFNVTGTTTHSQFVQQTFGDFNMMLYITSNGQTNFTSPIFDVTNNIGGGGTGCNPDC